MEYFDFSWFIDLPSTNLTQSDDFKANSKTRSRNRNLWLIIRTTTKTIPLFSFSENSPLIKISGFMKAEKKTENKEKLSWNFCFLNSVLLPFSLHVLRRFLFMVEQWRAEKNYFRMLLFWWWKQQQFAMFFNDHILWKKYRQHTVIQFMVRDMRNVRLSSWV